jgi:hypothetical protein
MTAAHSVQFCTCAGNHPVPGFGAAAAVSCKAALLALDSIKSLDKPVRPAFQAEKRALEHMLYWCSCCKDWVPC